MTERFTLSQREIKGQSIMAVVDAMSIVQERALKILAEQGITPLEKERWYPMERFLEVFRSDPAGYARNLIYERNRRL